MLFSLFYGSVFKNLANPSHMYYTSAMLNSRSKEGFFKKCCQVFLLKARKFLLNLVVYFYPRHLPAPAPATSTRESRPATVRHTPDRTDRTNRNALNPDVIMRCTLRMCTNRTDRTNRNALCPDVIMRCTLRMCSAYGP